VIPGPIPWDDRSVAGTVAELLLAIVNDRPAAPNAGKAMLLRLKV
jgi:hypothetical protein